ncbi:MAG: dTDP-4-dehydrorhamnose reductase, partial [Chloroflexota bacterium]|nr:dTDP-4-dehydrorhamnose reductase [Chloroflexota bacterium]
DLLTGRVVPGHYFWERLLALGVSESDLIELADDPCPPDVIGINHYLTSERLLDERIDRYPVRTHGGNWEHAYADIEAVRVCVDGPGGWDRLLRATWDRYGLPVAATEVHLACTREEQLRWLLEVWDTARALRREGIDVRAVTAWSLLGAFGWNRLVTQEGGDYEPGVFDLRAPSPRPTALAKLVKELATGQEPTHPVLTVAGWWRRPSRLHYPPVDRRGTDVVASTEMEVPGGTVGILVIGPAAPLREAFAASCAMRAIPCICRENSLPGSWESDIRMELAAGRPWAVAVTSLADVAVDDVEAVSRACAELGVPLLSCESGRVFPATCMVPAVPSELGPIGPVNGPHQATRVVEQALLAVHPGAIVVLGGSCVDPELWAGSGPETRRGRVGEWGEGDLIGDARALADTSIDLIIDGAAGVWHLATRLALAGDRLTFIEPVDPVVRSERKVS